MRWTALLFFSSMSVLASGLGCVGTPPPLGAQCERNSECQTPYVCRIARCRIECASQRDCPIGSLCVKDEDGLGACRLPDEATCATDDQCAGSLSCIEDECTQGCGEMDPCAPLGVCVVSPEGAHCENPLGTGCVNSTECPSGYRCSVEGRCEPRCNQNRDCPVGTLCLGGTCAMSDAGLPMDGAVDASDGAMDGSSDGSTDGAMDGSTDGSSDGSADGAMDGSTDGAMDGSTDGSPDGGVACTSPSDCTAANVMTADCVSGFCTVVACTTGFDDCDADFATGCETDLSLPASCGVCGGDCGLGGVCTSGTCDRVVDVTVAIATACFTRSSGSVYCVGRNDHGELGIGTTTSGASVVLSQVMMLTNAASASAGVHDSCIARGDGTAACIGANNAGQIGDGTMTSASFPRAVSGLTGVAEISTGGLLANNGFACALHTGGAVSCWGHQNGRGDGMTGNTNLPVSVSGLTDAIDLAAGGHHACAVRTGGGVVCWGTAGPWLGPAGTTTRLTPTAVTGVTATRIDTDQEHTCAVSSTGTVLCWGDNNSGRLGVDPATTTESATPVTVPGITDAVDVEVGGLTSCALRAGGTVKCWGFGGAEGALGGGVGSISFTPVDVIGLTTASVLSTGALASCVIRTDGSVACWGTNEREIGAGFDASVRWTMPTTHPRFPPTPTP